MKIHRASAWVVLLVATGATGYRLGTVREDLMADNGTRLWVMPYLAGEQSFSEIQNAKEVLQVLSVQYANDVILSSQMGATQSRAESRDEEADSSREWKSAIKQLEEGIIEFRGTEQELVLVDRLLRELKRGQACERWFEVYLETLYRHPTHEIIGRFADEAVRMSRAIGREDALRNAFGHLSEIPVAFGAKEQLQTAFEQLGRMRQPRTTNEFSISRSAVGRGGKT